MKHIRIKALNIVLMLMLMLGLMICVSAAVYADDDYTINYMEATLEEDTVVFSEKTVSNYSVLQNSITEWNNGYYVVDGNVTISDPVSVSGDVDLILCDNAQLELQSGIVLGTGSSLNIYSQNQSDTGKLIVKGSDGAGSHYHIDGYVHPTDGNAGITGNGTVIVHGGDVQIDGGNGGNVVEAYGVSRDGANGGAGLLGLIEIYDGVVTITGGEGGHGYGYGNGGDGGSGGHGIEGMAYVYGGRLTAVGGKGCQGCNAQGGAGNGGNGGHGISGYTIINGGIVKAAGGKGGNGGIGAVDIFNGQPGESGSGMNGSIDFGSNVTLYSDSKEITGPNQNITHVQGPFNGSSTDLQIVDCFMYADSVHTHLYRYEAGTGDKANTISAACKGTRACCNTTSVTITLNKPTDLAYDGNAKEATISGYPTTTVENLAAVPAIKYFKSTGAGSTETSGNELTGAPKEAGDYVAQITWGGATASVAFSIVGPAQYNLTFDPGEGSGTMAPVNVTDGQTYTFPKCTFKPPKNKSFDHWKMSGVDGIFYPGKTTTIASNCVQNGVITVTAFWKDGAEPTPTPTKVSGTPLTTMTASGDTAMKIAWEKVTGVDGYDIFFARCNKEDKKIETKSVQTIKGNSTFTWTVSGLKESTPYKAYVKAYVMKGGKKQYVKSSPLMHAYTKGYTKKHTNAKSVKVNKTKVSLNKGQTFKLKVKVKKLKKNKKLMPKKHVAKVRYLSTDTSIATVTSKGKIKGVKAGTCYVYAYAHNGVFKKITVTVK